MSQSTTLPPSTPTAHSASRRSFGPATALVCRECGERYELGARYACDQCFGPLEVSYDFGAPSPRYSST